MVAPGWCKAGDYTAPVAACPGCGETNPARARFCLACGRPLTGDHATAEQRKPVTVIFADVVGSTTLGEARDPEAVRRLMLRYFEEMRDVIARHGGMVEKFIGDAVMAVFGLPQVHEDDALRAVRAAADMRAALTRLNTELDATYGTTLQVRIGVNSGEVMAGAPGASTLVTGDAVNLAARLEQAAGAGEILLGPTTYGLVRDAVLAEEGPPLSVKGKAQPVAAWRLAGVIFGAPGRARRVDTTFVGRAHERSLLEWVFDRVARERTCHLVTVLGPAGVGKSRLVTEFLKGVGDAAKTLVGRCLPYGEGITFWPVAEVVRQATGIAENDDHPTALAKLRAAIGTGESAARVADEVAGLLGLGVTSSDPAWAVRKGLETLARNRPVAIVVEDLQWAEPTMLDLVEHVADWSRDAPLLIVAVARPELLDRRPGWGGGKVNATSLLLEPLGREEAGALLQALLGRATLEPRVRTRLVDTAGGNPLFLEELLAMLFDEGLLREVDGSWEPVGPLDELPLPGTIQALLAARLDSVAPPERDTLDRASVVGEEFDLATAAALHPPGHRAQVPDRVRALVRKELLRAVSSRSIDDDRFAFRHKMIRDAVYAAVPKQARATLHEQVADLLVAAADDRTGEFDELIGYHLEQAVRHRSDLYADDRATAELARRAAASLGVGGRRALARGDMPAAVTLLGRAAALLPATDVERAVVCTELGKALTEMGDMTAAAKAIDEATSVAERTGDLVARTRAGLARLMLASSVDLTGWVDEASGEAERAIAVLTDLGDDLGLAQAWGVLCEVHYLRGRVAASEEALRRCGEHARRAGDLREETDTAAGLAWTAVEGPVPVQEAIDRCEATLRRYAGHRSVEARTWRALAMLRAMRGELDESRALLRRSAEGFTDLGQRYWLAATDDVAGRVALLAGDRAEAARAYRAAAEQLEHIGDVVYLPIVLASLSMSLDDPREAAALVERSRAAAEPEDVMAQILWRLADAHRRRRAADVSGAVDAAAAAAALASDTDALDLQGDALSTLGVMHAMSDAADEARDSLEAALDRYERKGNLVSAGRVRAEIARL